MISLFPFSAGMKIMNNIAYLIINVFEVNKLKDT